MRRPTHRGVLLHARSRGAATTGVALLAVACLAPLTGRALMRAGADPGVVFHVQVLAVAAGVALSGAGLTGADPDLETTTARSGPRLRLAHLAVALLVTAGALTLGVAALGGRTPGPVALDPLVTVRDVALLGGALALTAPFLGARLSWLTPTLWTLLLLAVGPREHGWRLLASAPLLPGASTAAAVTAGGLLIVGAANYVLRAAPR